MWVMRSSTIQLHDLVAIILHRIENMVTDYSVQFTCDYSCEDNWYTEVIHITIDQGYGKSTCAMMSGSLCCGTHNTCIQDAAVILEYYIAI